MTITVATFACFYILSPSTAVAWCGQARDTQDFHKSYSSLLTLWDQENS
jgi:hypothetical protein